MFKSSSVKYTYSPVISLANTLSPILTEMFPSASCGHLTEIITLSRRLTGIFSVTSTSKSSGSKSAELLVTVKVFSSRVFASPAVGT